MRPTACRSPGSTRRAPRPTGAADAHASLGKVLGYTGADLVEAACARVPVERRAVGADGVIRDLEARAAIEASVTTLARRVRERR